MGLSFRAAFNRDYIDPSKYTVRVAVGYTGRIHRSGYPMAELAEMLTFGTEKIPARPHIEEGLEAGEAWIKEHIAEYLRQNRRKRDASGIGEAMVQAIKAYVYSGALQPNAPYTVRKKGFDQPLFETGELMDDLDYDILRMGGEP